MSRAGSRRALTLVELMIAVALGTILVGIVTFVWMQSNRIFTSTVNRLETYQRLRVLLDSVERDLANTARTTHMEYFVEPTATSRNGHFDLGDQLMQETTSGTVNPPGAAPPAFRLPRDPSDPLVIAGVSEEFDESSSPGATTYPHAGFSSFPYFYGPMVFSPPPYEITAEDYLTDRFYWRDEVMVRTFALADGLNRPAIVHYRLVQPQPGMRSVLRRRMWFLDEGGRIIDPRPSPNGEPPGTDRVSLLANDVCDFKVAFFFKESASSQTGSSQANGYWYHVGHAPDGTSGRDKLIQTDREQGYYDALTGNPGSPGVPALSSQHVQRRQFILPSNPDAASGTAYNAVAFFYQGAARIELDQGRAMLRTISALDTPMPPSNSPGTWPEADFGWGGSSDSRTYQGYETDPTKYTNFGFPGVRPGDKIELFDATDDDGNYLPTVYDRDVNGNGVLDDPAPPGRAGIIFPDGEYTVEVISSDGSQDYVSLQLTEPINFFRLRRHWLAIEPIFEIAVPNYAPDLTSLADPITNPDGPDRRVVASFNVRYRVGFLPAAFRVRLSIDDKFNRKVLPMERVIKLLQQ